MSALLKLLDLIRKNGPQQEPFAHFSDPGGYPIYYITRDGNALCPDCCNKHQEIVSDIADSEYYIVCHAINYENITLDCHHCNEIIPAAYAEREIRDTLQS